MNVRDATFDDEPWLLGALDALGLQDKGFRSYHYVVVTTDGGDRVGFGRLTERDEDTVELTHVGATEEPATLIRAHAAQGLVKRAVQEGYRRILAVAESERPFEAIGFEASPDDRDAVDAAATEIVLRWVPPSARDDDEGSEETAEDGRDHKYDPDAPSTEESPASTAAPSDDDTTDDIVDAAHRQGIDPESVETKYGTNGNADSGGTKYEA